MVLPETISVQYTEDEAGYVSIRPVRRQTFRIAELLDMLLGVAGKDAARIQQILRAGTAVFHDYRYWWTGFEAGTSELNELLERFPNPDPARAFRMEDSRDVLLEGPGAQTLAEISRAQAARRRFLRRRSFWDALAQFTKEAAPRYLTYSYARHADLFAAEATREQVARLADAALRWAPRALRAQLGPLLAVTRIVFVCPRAK